MVPTRLPHVTQTTMRQDTQRIMAVMTFVILMGCTQVSPSTSSQTTLMRIAHEAIADIYELPIEQIHDDTSLYYVSPDPAKLGMDFRILLVRKRLEDEAKCHINTKAFATIKTAGDLFRVAGQHCE